MDKVEESMPSAEENDQQEKDLKEEELTEEQAEHVKGEDDAADVEELGDDSEHEGGGEREDKVIPKAAKKKIPFITKSKEKKRDEVLNLNNEVVWMRKEVKRVRALIIRKLTRQMGALKKKKGKGMEVEKNQRRVARLLEEVRAMKVLSPDVVTKTALQKDLDFEQVCKNPKSTISDRALARIATHPQFKKKIEVIKAAVKAFKEERMKGRKPGGREKVQNKAEKVTLQSPEEKEEGKSERTEENIKVEQKEIFDKEEGGEILQDTKEAAVAEPEKETVEASPSVDTAVDLRKKTPKTKNVQLASIKSSEVKDIVRNKPQSNHAEKKPELKPTPKLLPKKEEGGESDLEASDDDEEKEYFDDSTEERFNKQSSQSEESDNDDDNGFFVGKVSKFKKKKKKKQKSVAGDEANRSCEGNPPDQVQSELDELETRLKSKAPALQSVFCSSLSSSKLGRGRGRGADRFSGHAGLGGDFNKHPKFQKQENEAERNPGSKYSKPSSESFPSVGRGRGRGRGGGRGGGVFTHQEPQQALHPSWEASKKRKEQQGQILAFQGKKIKFDD
ncbi:serum response factor-binding protein 1 [Pungitius pungitius]|uniref:serum response factor-binding protein 1 n=1 Tax=Pungitius pungitius TaxID=134920 RepID=UPI002E10F78F